MTDVAGTPDTAQAPDAAPPRGEGSRGGIVRNTALNAGSTVVLLVVSVAAVPFLVDGLGTASFGFLSVIWAFVGYFGLLDLGVSRAATKQVADALARGARGEARSVITASLAVSVTVGVLLGLGLVAARGRVLSLLGAPDSLGPDAERALVYGAASLPFVLAAGVQRGVLMAAFRFGAANGIQLVAGVAQWAGAAALAATGHGVGSILGLTLLVRVVTAAATAAGMSRLLGMQAYSASFGDRRVLRGLAGFSGWAAVSQLIGPLFTTVDRMIIGSYASLTAVAYYSLPLDGLQRLLYLAVAFGNALFPALSTHAAQGGGGGAFLSTVERSLVVVGSLFALICAVLIIFAREILAAWVGADIAAQSSTVMVILTAGMVWNLAAQIPFTALHAAGRPEVPARLHIVEIVLFVAALALVVPRFGIIGAAAVWTGRAVVDSWALLASAWRIAGRDRGGAGGERVLRTWVAINLLIVAAVAVHALPGAWTRGAAGILLVAAAVAAFWRLVLSGDDRSAVVGAVTLRALRG